MIKLFHGTSSKRGQQILEEKSLKVNAPKVYVLDHPLPTTQGYIYLTNDLINAIYYGNMTASDDIDKELFVFSIELDKNSLEPDLDEIKYALESFNSIDKIKDIENPTVEESLNAVLSVRIGQDINFNSFKAEYTKISSSMDMGKKERGYNITEVISLVKNNDEYAIKRKEEYISRLKWIDI